jgi:APA family basic amino acid/polyamine antiporter
MSSLPLSKEPAPAAGAGFQQRLGLFDATMLVAGSMIGSGIFIVSAEISQDVGTAGWLLLVWVLTGVITVMGALSYGELAAMMPHAGGQYVYLREAYSPLFGFLYGWTLFLVIQTGTIAAVAVAFAKFTGVFVPGFGADPDAGAWALRQDTPFGRFTVTAGQLLGVLMILLLTTINCLGVREGKWVQNLFTVAKIGALGLLVGLGLAVAANPQVVEANFRDLWGGIVQTVRFDQVHSRNLRVGVPYVGLAAWMVVGGAMVGSLFSADAWNNVTFTAGEVRHPRRNLPLSLALGTGLVILLYVLANVAYVRALPVEGEGQRAEQVRHMELMAARLDRDGHEADARILRDEAKGLLKEASTTERGIAYAKDGRVGTALMELVWPQFGVQAMAIAIMISTFGCTNGLILSGARLYYAMAQDSLFFRSVGRLNRHGVPAAGLILQAVWASLLTFSGTYGQLLNYVIFAALLFYVLTVAGLFVLRRTQPDAERPYRAIGYPVLPALYVGLCAALMLDVLVVKWEEARWGLLIVLAGIPVFFLWRWRAATANAV